MTARTISSTEPRAGRGRLAHLLAVAREHPLRSTFILALATRVAMAVALRVGFANGVFLDPITYSRLAAQRASGDTGGWRPYDFALFRSVGTFIWPLTWLYRLFGVDSLLGATVAIAYGTAAAVIVAWIARQVLGARWAFAVGIAAAVWPSQVLWSSMTLKDSAVWCATAGLGAVAIQLNRAQHGRARLTCAVVGLALLFALGFLRDHVLVVAAWSLIGAMVVGPAEGRRVRVLGAVGAALLVPLFCGAGFAGSRVIGSVDELEQRREQNAANATTSFVTPEAPTSTVTEAPSTTTVAAPNTTSTSTVASTAAPPAHAGSGLASDLRHLPRGLSVMLLEPVPWATHGNRSLQLALVDMVLWYPALVFAAIGVLETWRRRESLVYPLLLGVGTVFLYALSEGNVGTAFRHRGEVVWVVVLFAAVGMARLYDPGRVQRLADLPRADAPPTIDV